MIPSNLLESKLIGTKIDSCLIEVDVKMKRRMPIKIKIDTFDVSEHSSSNKESVLASDNCGCYHCGNVMSSKTVEDFTTDDTALCPICSIDSIVTHQGLLNKEILLELSKIWF